jgi:type IV pilus assembly protein PilA
MRRIQKGFTLIELMIVVAIIGILAAIAIPNFIRFQARSKQAEAKTNLKAIYTAQKSYFGLNDHFSNVAGGIGFTPERGNRYNYLLDAACATWEDRTTTIAVGQGAATCVDADLLKFPTFTAHVVAEPGTSGIAAVTFVPGAAGENPPTANPPFQLVGFGNLDSWTALAFGQIDNDLYLDAEFIANSPVDQGVITAGACWEATPAGVGVPPGTPYIVGNDVGCDT